MQCPICAALKRDLSWESEIEAASTLKQRAQLTAIAADHSPVDLKGLILTSRKRQAHIETELFEHCEEVHGGVPKAASA